MKHTSLALVITLALLLFALAAPMAAAGQPPAGGACPAGFELHEFMAHDGEDAHHLIGLAVDLNGNGLICVKHLDNGLHVHADDVLR